MTALGILPAYGVQCYGDLGFQSLTCALILGVALAVAGKVSRLTPPGGAAGDARADAGVRARGGHGDAPRRARGAAVRGRS